MYEQLIQPDLNVQGQDDECLVYVREVFGAPPKYSTATVGWQNLQYPHTGNPPNNAVPIWFSWTGTINGVTQNYGHVAVWANGKIYSTSAQGDKTFNSIQALVSYMGGDIKYLGWSEDINGVRVVQPQEEEEMPNEGDVVNAYHYVGETATATDIAVYTSKAWSAPDGLFYGKLAIDIANLQKFLAAAQSAETISKQSVLSYIESNLS